MKDPVSGRSASDKPPAPPKPHSGPYLAADSETWVLKSDYDNLVEQLEELRDEKEEVERCFDSSTRSYEAEIAGLRERVIPAHWADVFGQVEALQIVLRQISDESYVGNYAPLEVINIYRSWAHNALLAAKEAMTDVDSIPASSPKEGE